MRAERVLIGNIRWLLDRDGLEQRALTDALGRNQAWLSKILHGDGENKRGIRVKDLDPIAAFFGVRVEQLFSAQLPAASLPRRAAARPRGRRLRSSPRA